MGVEYFLDPMGSSFLLGRREEFPEGVEDVGSVASGDSHEDGEGEKIGA